MRRSEMKGEKRVKGERRGDKRENIGEPMGGIEKKSEQLK